ncbi:hypothetical protein [Planococcus lenghuensis]|uniref:Uncharacterized protein n=1 Tax=Planococcus lenghuensis TaxID=2213202 RepID=A0A1Q2KUI0_9BACL|nr:hypothetical protein [Planococcus lenghuensis]AQQ51868.1 hypothetical protein B0X71_01190 [Planococcus lenghuensis]
MLKKGLSRQVMDMTYRTALLWFYSSPSVQSAGSFTETCQGAHQIRAYCPDRFSPDIFKGNPRSKKQGENTEW